MINARAYGCYVTQYDIWKGSRGSKLPLMCDRVPRLKSQHFNRISAIFFTIEIKWKKGIQYWIFFCTIYLFIIIFFQKSNLIFAAPNTEKNIFSKSNLTFSREEKLAQKSRDCKVQNVHKNWIRFAIIRKKIKKGFFVKHESHIITVVN